MHALRPRGGQTRARCPPGAVQTARRHKQKKLPDAISITPRNLYDDGTVGDDRSFFKELNHTYSRPSIEWVEFEGPIYETWPPKAHQRILFDSPLRESDPDAYVKAVLRKFMGRADRRPATGHEVDRFHKVYRLIAPEMDTFEAAMRETLAMVLISPQFLMHTVVKDGVARKEHALVSRLAYFLWASMPDDELLALASERPATPLRRVDASLPSDVRWATVAPSPRLEARASAARESWRSAGGAAKGVAAFAR